MLAEMTHLGQEEYVWAMRTSDYSRSPTDFRHGLSQPTDSMAPSRSVADVMSLDEKQTRVMASLVPDEVINSINDYSHRDFEACFLFGDVSGFTDLCEKYSKTGVAGPSKMTQVLNKYLGSMVQEVLSYGGDVFKFSGDAFIAIFKTSDTDTMRDAVHEALDCALVIQKNYGSFVTDVGIVIRVKLVVASGTTTFALIGDEAHSDYVVVGKPIWDVKSAEHISHAGDIIVVPTAWAYVSANEYLYQDVPDSVHIKILGVGPNWRSVQRNLKQLKAVDITSVFSAGSEGSDADALSDITLEGVEDYFIRPAVNRAVKLKMKEFLRRFIITPVIKCVDNDEPFEYLSEMRQTVVVFINIVTQKLENEETVCLTDQSYKIVSRVVNKMKGCVNKVSLFDKGLMFVVIFGLRGNKHELECQAALRCSRECHSAIEKLSGITSASVGVTTGKTYCGVFGHTLRREYTVISLLVNKAARLMVAYEGKVTCDRETFLHSKLESTNFILQEFKPLKGITQPGPVYEFREVEVDRDVVQKINASPLLGRKENLKHYRRILNKHLNDPDSANSRMFLIKGEARQGKSRLLDELVYITPEEIPVTKFTLTKKDFIVPYQTMRLIFYPPLYLNKNSTLRQRGISLLDVLQTVKVPDLLCVYNDIFRVDFAHSASYLSFNEKNRKKALRKMVKLLARACFVKFWVLAIDDIEFMDEYSLDLFSALFEVKTIFIVASISSISKLGKLEIPKVFADHRVQLSCLRPVQRSCLGALACQIMDVYAVSPELEYAIQTKSNGNPGWVESYLISLMQCNALEIFLADLEQINDLGLVCPPLYMMARLTDDQRKKWQHIMEERRPSLDSLTEPNQWKNYIDCCRDAYLNITVREQMEHFGEETKVPICVITSRFNMESEEMELSLDVIILKTFDSLSFFERHLVKCSAILGTQFFRNMLLYVMATSEKRKVALAVQKLFEIRVLACAKGDFVTDGTTVFLHKLLNPLEETDVKCHCRGVKKEDTCADLPKYASCGYMQFRSSLFRDITYNLLTDYQKKEFHGRAIRYLERETRKCVACGGGIFEHMIGVKHDKNLLLAKTQNKYTTSLWGEDHDSRSSVSSHSMSQYSVQLSVGGGIDTSPSRTSIFDRRKSKADEKSLRSVSQFNMTPTSSARMSKVIGLGFRAIARLKNRYSLTRAFSREDFIDCQCHLILSTAFAQLIDHCMGAGDMNKTVEAMLEYARICIVSSNIALAISILEQAFDVLKSESFGHIENIWKISLIRAKIYILMGYSKLELGYLDEAFDTLHKALAQYEIKFPKGIRKTMMSNLHEFKQFIGFYLFPKSLIKYLDHWGTVYSNNLAECLGHLCTLYMIKNDWKNAELAATWSLSKALASFTNFQVMCTACANMLKVAIHYQRPSLCVALEVHSLRLCHLKIDSINSEDLKCVCSLYATIFMSRLNRLYWDKLIHLGYIILRLASSVRAPKLVLPILPLMVYALLYCGDFGNAYPVLQEALFFAEADTDCTGSIWYHALALGLHMETGYTVLNYETCDKFYQFECQKWSTIRDPDARRRFFTLMWLWCIRNDEYESAQLWSIKTDSFNVVKPTDSYANKITALYLLEGLMLNLVSKLDKRNIKAITRADTEVKHLLSALENVSKTDTLLLPRLYHLKAYYRYIIYNDSKVTELLAKARKLANKQGNLLEVGWIDYSKKGWTKALTPEQIDFWKDHSETGNTHDFRELGGADEKIGYFTLPSPQYM